MRQGPELALFEDWRHERKFVVPEGELPLLAAALKARVPGFKRAYEDRWVNSIYMEAPGLEHALDHLEGRPQRHKLRLRWYGAPRGLLRAPHLEVKLKQGLWGGKWRYPLPALRLDAGFSAKKLWSLLASLDLPRGLLNDLRRSTLFSFQRYRRSYLAAGPLRVTLDRSLRAGAGRPGGAPPARLQRVGSAVLELKYPPGLEGSAAQVLQGLGLRLGRHSKYLAGAAAWHG